MSEPRGKMVRTVVWRVRCARCEARSETEAPSRSLAEGHFTFFEWALVDGEWLCCRCIAKMPVHYG